MTRAPIMLVLALVSASCVADTAEARPFDDRAYDRALAVLGKRRQQLGRQLHEAKSEIERRVIRAEARKLVLGALDDVIFPAWMGTRWSMGPTSTASRPHQEGKTVGCSYFVTGALQNAGLRFDSRARFAQAPALHIQRSLAPEPAELHRYLSITAPELAEKLGALDDGLYIIGLRNHIGFVRLENGAATFIHSGPTGPGAVQREPLAEAPSVIESRPSGYFVTSVFADDRLIDHWLLGRPVAFQKLGTQ